MATNLKNGLNSTETLQAPVKLLVETSITIPSPEICVICLDLISEKVTALPCGHDNFDFPCLGTWLQIHQLCPLCKKQVRAIRQDDKSDASRIIPLPSAEVPQRSGRQTRAQRYPYRGPRRERRRQRSIQNNFKDSALDFRKHVYKYRLFSFHVGANRISRYRNITPASFLADEHLVSRARMWIRRELAVFDFLNPDSDTFGSTDRRASNAEFLLEYIVGILKSIDLKGSTGQAEELLKDFLGRDNTQLFLHELEAWLRSPYESLENWDRAVQYANPFNSERPTEASSSVHQRAAS